ncbi:MAG: hypothetical protein M3347_15310 [Armatimonadota bacterium]|nr:hypothetical protein [Armatimonadota bacterium]
MERDSVLNALDKLITATATVHMAALELKQALNQEPAGKNEDSDSGGEPQRYQIPEGAKPRRCKGCGATIYFVATTNGRNMPVESDGQSHWEHCSSADQFRKD